MASATKGVSRFFVALVALLFSMSSVQAQEIVIDRLGAAQAPLVATLATPASGTVSDAATIIGTERDVMLVVGSGTSATVEVSDGPGLEFSVQAGTQAVLTLVWDGVDGDPGTLDHTGLGGVDVTNGGVNDALSATVQSAGTSTLGRYTVYTDATHCSTALAPQGTEPITTDDDPVAVFATFNEVIDTFETCDGAAGPADYTSVGAIVFEVTMLADETIPLQIPTGSITSTALATLLPVELAQFTAQADGNDVQFRWTTASETNNAGFELEQQVGAQWESRAYVAGAGTTTEVTDYQHRLGGLAAGRHTFRLKQIDLDGTVSYSAQVEVALDLPGTHALSPAYPNPFNPATQFSLTIAREQAVTVVVFDLLGRVVATLHDGPLTANEAHTFTFDAAPLPSGVYLYRASGETFTATRTVTLLK